MKISGIYVLAWVLAIVGAVILVASGNVNEATIPVLGFAFSALLFGGFVALLPIWLERIFSPKTRLAARKGK